MTLNLSRRNVSNWLNQQFLLENQIANHLSLLHRDTVLSGGFWQVKSDRLLLYFFSPFCSPAPLLSQSVLHSLLDTVHVRVSEWVCKEEFRKNHFATLFLKRDLPTGSGFVRLFSNLDFWRWGLRSLTKDLIYLKVLQGGTVYMLFYFAHSISIKNHFEYFNFRSRSILTTLYITYRDDFALIEWNRLFVSHTVYQFILYQIH